MIEPGRCHDINAWEQRKLGDILSYEQPYEYIVSSDDYSPVARTPVLTAGKTLILGYTNEADGIKAVTKDSPVIIFDDFTASSHIIDYSFKIKSSAMKILSLRDSENDLYCIYYALTRIIRPSASHERQWISKYARATVTIPSKDEQQVIGDFLRKLDRLIAAEKRKLDLLQKKKRALLRQIFEQKLRFAGYNNPWERCRLGDITEFADYGIAASAIPYDGTVRYLRITDIDDETRQVNIYELPSPDMKHRSRKEDYLRQGDLVFARTGASVGKTYLNRSDRDDIVHAGFLIRFRLKDNICPEFIYQQTLGENYRKFIAITSQRSGQPGINSSEYADWTLYLTSIEEQNQIGGLFGQLDELIAALTQKIDLLMIKKKALLQQMFV